MLMYMYMHDAVILLHPVLRLNMTCMTKAVKTEVLSSDSDSQL